MSDVIVEKPLSQTEVKSRVSPMADTQQTQGLWHERLLAQPEPTVISPTETQTAPISPPVEETLPAPPVQMHNESKVWHKDFLAKPVNAPPGDGNDWLHRFIKTATGGRRTYPDDPGPYKK